VKGKTYSGRSLHREAVNLPRPQPPASGFREDHRQVRQ